MNPPPAAIILAAGFSTRMGRPKAQLEYRGETFLLRLVRLLGLHCAPVLVVDSQPALIPAALTVLNPDPSRGMLSSLQCGFAALPETVPAVAFTPVDYPAITEETLDLLIPPWAGELIRIPRFQGRRGHPVLIDRCLIPEFLALPHTAQARDVIHLHAEDITYIDVDDPGIVQDIDTPAEYERLR